MGSVGQISLFDGQQRFRITKPIRLIELFAGIGSQAKALTNLGVEFEHHRVCEFDKYAVTSYNAVHGTDFKPSDIREIKGEDLGITNTDKYCYILTYSFPCQDLSNAGKGAGMAKGSSTRSGLLWEVERLLTETKELPTVLVMENIPQVVSEKNIKDFAQWVAFLDGLGYKSKWEIINAKDYGIPQNRERCFMVSMLGDYYYEFPAKKPLKKRLKDMLEDSVDGRYYLSDKALNGVLNTAFNCSKLDSRTAHNGVIPTLCARDYKDPKLVVEEPKVAEPMTTRGSDIASTIRASIHKQGERNLIKNLENGLGYEGVIEPIVWDGFNQRIRADSECVGTITQNVGADLKRNGQGIIEPLEGFDLSEKMKAYINSYNGKYKVSDGNLVVNREIAVAKTTREGCTRADSSDYISTEMDGNKNVAGMDLLPYRIRKLTPKECWRLMGFTDKDVDSAVAVGMSNTQLYKQAGNSIVVQVLEAIFGEML